MVLTRAIWAAGKKPKRFWTQHGPARWLRRLPWTWSFLNLRMLRRARICRSFTLLTTTLADVMTESFSVCEAAFLQNGVDNLDGPTGAAAFYSGMAEQAAAQGITYTVASGDSGPDGCANPSALAASGLGASVNFWLPLRIRLPLAELNLTTCQARAHIGTHK